jgi:hypothetical protein
MVVRGALCVMVLLVAWPTASAAQDDPKVTLSGGWQLQRVVEETLAKGWYVDFGGNLDRTFAIVGEVSRGSKSVTEADVVSGVRVTATGSMTVDAYLAGVRFSARASPRVVPFGQVLTGVARGQGSVDGIATANGLTVTVSESESSTNLASVFGGGVDLFLTRVAGVRIGGSYMRIAGADGEGGANVLRFGVGFVAAF